MEPVLPFELLFARRRQRGSVTRELHQQLRAAILDGRLKPGAELPSTRRLSSALGIARNTVIAAYDLLIAEGYLTSQPGAPMLVAETVAVRARGRRRVALSGFPLNEMWRSMAEPQAPSAPTPPRSFSLGTPEHRHFPHALWRRLTARSMREWSKQPFAYYPTEGIAPLREAIANHVAFTRAVVCTAEDVIATSGAHQAFDLLARVLIVPGKSCVAVEKPCYEPMRVAFTVAGARIVEVPVDDEGIRVDLISKEANIVCVTPSHQAPSGVVMSLARRRLLLDFCDRNNALVIEDDYDSEFRFSNRPLDALQTLDRSGRAFYVGTFSKVLFPSLRKGFIVTPSWARDMMIKAKQISDSHCDFVAQRTLASFIDEGYLAKYVRRMNQIYATRRDVLLEGMEKYLSNWLEPLASAAGLHVSARVRSPSVAATLKRVAIDHVPGAKIFTRQLTDTKKELAIALGYGRIDVADIEPALRALAKKLSSQ
jgi:GntR family transcriptional regulator/MocR family aminotransferase